MLRPGVGGGEAVAQPVKGLKGFRLLHIVFRHPAHHLAPGHLAHGALFHHFISFQLAEGAGQHLDMDGQVGEYRLAVFLGGQVDHQVGLSRQGVGQLVPQKAYRSLAPSTDRGAAISSR